MRVRTKVNDVDATKGREIRREAGKVKMGETEEVSKRQGRIKEKKGRQQTKKKRGEETVMGRIWRQR